MYNYLSLNKITPKREAIDIANARPWYHSLNITSKKSVVLIPMIFQYLALTNNQNVNARTPIIENIFCLSFILDNQSGLKTKNEIKEVIRTTKKNNPNVSFICPGIAMMLNIDKNISTTHTFCAVVCFFAFSFSSYP